MPTFGHSENPFATEEFDLEFADLKAHQVVSEHYRSYTDPGSGPVMDFIRSGGSDSAALQMAGRLVFQALVDDDGLSVDADKPVRGEDEDDGSWDNRLDEWNNRERWSSKRRFSTVVYGQNYKLAGSAVIELAEWIAKKAVGRPTKAL